jgi:hypothetical protein
MHVIKVIILLGIYTFVMSYILKYIQALREQLIQRSDQRILNVFTVLVLRQIKTLNPLLNLGIIWGHHI